MSSEGLEMVGGRNGLAGNDLKWSKNQENSDNPRWPSPLFRWPDPGASGGG